MSGPTAPAELTPQEINHKYSVIAAEQGDLQFAMFDLKDQQNELVAKMAKIEARQFQLRQERDVLQKQLFDLTAKERAEQKTDV